MFTRMFVCLCLGLLSLTLVTTLATATEIKIAGVATDTVFTGKVTVIYENNQVGGKVLGYTLCAPAGAAFCNIRMEEGGDKIKALVGTPADGTVTVEATGTTYRKNNSPYMICKSAKKL